MDEQIFNGNLRKCQVLIEFTGLTDEQREWLYKAEECLGKAGIRFDTGGFVDCSCGARHWEFDYSLSDNVTVWIKPEKTNN